MLSPNSPAFEPTTVKQYAKARSRQSSRTSKVADLLTPFFETPVIASCEIERAFVAIRRTCSKLAYLLLRNHLLSLRRWAQS